MIVIFFASIAYWTVVVVFCIWSVGYGVRLFHLTRKARTWHQAIATVLSFDWSLTKYGGKPHVVYTFTIGERTIHSSQITIDDFLITQGAWQVDRIRKRFQPGQSVPVYFDPNDPGKSILLQCSFGWSIFWIVFGIGSFIGSIAFAQ